MTVAYDEGIRNSKLTEVSNAVDAGAGPGLLRIYDGVRPATGGVTTTLLAELTLSDPSFGAPAAGVITANAITDESSAPIAGTATWARVVDSDSNFCFDIDVGLVTSGADLELDDVDISINDIVSISSLTITEGNP